MATTQTKRRRPELTDAQRAAAWAEAWNARNPPLRLTAHQCDVLALLRTKRQEAA